MSDLYLLTSGGGTSEFLLESILPLAVVEKGDITRDFLNQPKEFLGSVAYTDKASSTHRSSYSY